MIEDALSFQAILDLIANNSANMFKRGCTTYAECQLEGPYVNSGRIEDLL
jgi:hypothetical protein